MNDNSGRKYLAITLAVVLIVMIGASLVSVAGNLLSGFGWFFNNKFFYNGGVNSESVGEDFSTQREYRGVQSIKIEADTANIIVSKQQNTDSVKVFANGDDSNSFSTSESGGVLKIKDKNSQFNFLGVSNTEIEIVIPEGVSIDFDVKCGAGRFNADSLECTSFNIDSGVGEVNIASITSRSANFNVGVGNVEVSNANIMNTDINSGIGELTINYSSPVDGFLIDVDKGISTVEVNGKSYRKGNHQNGKAPNRIKIDNGIGSIRLNFSEY